MNLSNQSMGKDKDTQQTHSPALSSVLFSGCRAAKSKTSSGQLAENSSRPSPTCFGHAGMWQGWATRVCLPAPFSARYWEHWEPTRSTHLSFVLPPPCPAPPSLQDNNQERVKHPQTSTKTSLGSRLPPCLCLPASAQLWYPRPPASFLQPCAEP